MSYLIDSPLDWNIVFSSVWKNFSFRMSGILQRLSDSKQALDAKSNTVTVLEHHTFRREKLEHINSLDQERSEVQLQNILAWLGPQLQNQYQIEKLDNILWKRQNGTCEWIVQNPQMRSWLDPEDARPLLWLHGSPGSGMSDSIIRPTI